MGFKLNLFIFCPSVLIIIAVALYKYNITSNKIYKMNEYVDNIFCC